MNQPVNLNENSKAHYLSSDQLEELGARIEAVRREIMHSLNEKDAQYIYKIRNFVRIYQNRNIFSFPIWHL
jgi:hypothetical protein